MTISDPCEESRQRNILDRSSGFGTPHFLTILPQGRLIMVVHKPNSYLKQICSNKGLCLNPNINLNSDLTRHTVTSPRFVLKALIVDQRCGLAARFSEFIVSVLEVLLPASPRLQQQLKWGCILPLEQWQHQLNWTLVHKCLLWVSGHGRCVDFDNVSCCIFWVSKC